MFTDFFVFVKSQEVSEETFTSIRTRVIFISKAFLLLLVFKVVIAMINVFLVKIGWIDKILTGENLRIWLSQTSQFNFFLEVIILAPVLEEIAFRGILQRSGSIIKLALSMIFYLSVCKIFRLDFYSISIQTAPVIGIASLILLIPQSYMISVTKKLNKPLVHRCMLWISALLFAFWHYYNHDFSEARIQTIAMTLLPHVLSGLIFSWTSLRFGLQWSLSLHIINNLVPVLMTLAADYLG